MSAKEQIPQPESPGALFSLSAEIRAIIWEMVLFVPPSRVCSQACLRANGGNHPNLTNSGNESELFVYDYPVLRYVCRESRQEAIYYSAVLGWEVSGHEPPKRRYEPNVDVLYLGPYGYSHLLHQSFHLLRHNYTNRPVPMAARQVRKARHIALPYFLEETDQRDMETILKGCPQVEKVSMVIGNVGMEDTMDVKWHSFVTMKKFPRKPCTLTRVPRLEPIRLEVSEADMLAYMRRYVTKRAYADVEKACAEFAEMADTVAHRLECQSLPPPQLAMVLQLTEIAEEGQKWEEVRSIKLK